MCKKHEKLLILVVGKNDLGERELRSMKIEHVFSISEKVMNTDDAMRHAAEYLEELGLDVYRLIIKNQRKSE